MDKKLENWLQEHGGSAIQLRLCSINGSKNESLNAISTLLDIEEVHSLLNLFDQFRTSGRDIKALEHLIHSYRDTCIDNFFPIIMDLGFKAGVDIFDQKITSVADTFKYVFSLKNESTHCYNYTLMLHRYFFISGYIFPEVIESLENRLNAIHKSAKEKIFEIYQDSSKLPKKPKVWTEVGVLKDELNPFKITAQKPLPNIYDIWALAYYVNMCKDKAIINKINDIVAYILEPAFQNIREGYGLLWVKERRIYHACGWSPTLPLYDDKSNYIRSGTFLNLDCIDFMSYFKTVHKSKWFQNCLRHLEQYKTEKGTYIFPKEYLHKKYIDKAFLNDKYINLKRNERELLKRELVSTMKMVEIYNRIN